MKFFVVVCAALIIFTGLITFGQSHSIEKRSVKLLLGAKAALLKKKLGLLGLGAISANNGGYGYGGYDHQSYGGGEGGIQLGGLLDKKLSLLGLKGGISNGGYADGYSYNHNQGYSNAPEKVVIVKVVSDGGYNGVHNAGNTGGYAGDYNNGYYGGYNGGYNSGYYGGYNGVYNVDSNSGYNGVYNSGFSGQGAYNGVSQGHGGYNYNHVHYPGC